MLLGIHGSSYYVVAGQLQIINLFINLLDEKLRCNVLSCCCIITHAHYCVTRYFGDDVLKNHLFKGPVLYWYGVTQPARTPEIQNGLNKLIAKHREEFQKHLKDAGEFLRFWRFVVWFKTELQQTK